MLYPTYSTYPLKANIARSGHCRLTADRGNWVENKGLCIVDESHRRNPRAPTDRFILYLTFYT